MRTIPQDVKERIAAMLNAPAWAARVVGVFSPAINAAELARQVSA